MDPESMKGLVTTGALRAGCRTRIGARGTWEMSAFSLKMLGKMIIAKSPGKT